MIVLQIALIVSLLAAICVMGYYALLALGALLRRRNCSAPPARQKSLLKEGDRHVAAAPSADEGQADSEPVPLFHDAKHTFAIVIPAHNEESVLAGTLESCNRLDYPANGYRVFVVADNCSDATSQIALQHGATCLERHEPDARGKGRALQWAFERILPLDFDAVVVLDADCQLQHNALRAFDRALQNGVRAAQANYVASNPSASVFSYAVAVGNFIENELFYAPKSDWGLAVLLRGTGMMLHSNVLKQIPWHAHSIVEDAEYSLQLIRAGIDIRFLRDVKVTSPFPAEGHQLRVQRDRWSAGNTALGKKQIWSLIREGLARRSAKLLDAGWTLLVLSRPLVLMQVLATVALAVVCTALYPSPLNSAGALCAAAVVAGHISYLSLGVLMLGLDARRALLLAAAPLVIGQLTVTALKGLVGIRPSDWQRTPRIRA